MTLICALRFADFLRLCLSPRTTSRTISFSISNSFLGRASARPQLGGQRRRCHDIYIYRPCDFRSRSLNRRLTASCFVVSAHSVRWIDTHDACGSCRPKVCLREVVELQKQEKNSCKKLLGTGTRKAGQIWSQTASVACSQYKTWACTCVQWILTSQLEFLGWDLPKFVCSTLE